MATTTGPPAPRLRLRDVFECDLAAYLVVTGTAANALALAACCPPHGAVVCHQEAHINTDECGAPELYTGGAKLLGVRGAGRQAHARSGRPPCSTPWAAANTSSGRACCRCRRRPSSAPSTRPPRWRARGTGPRAAHARCTWTAPASPTRSCASAARRPNSPGRRAWTCSSFGATKNGALGRGGGGVLRPRLADDFLYRRKRAGQLVSKSRYLGAQMLAYLADDLWLTNARHANAMADRAGRRAARATGRAAAAADRRQRGVRDRAAGHARAPAGGGARYLVWPGEGPGTDAVGAGRDVHPPADVVPHDADDVRALRRCGRTAARLSPS